MTEATGKRAVEFEQMLGDGNKAIFDNIYPAMLAYQQGGIGELRQLNASVIASKDNDKIRAFAPIVAAMEDIDAGIRLKAQGQAAAGEKLIRDGNTKLIEHEQFTIAQPVAFDKYPDLAFLMSPLAFGDFDADSSKIDKATVSYFWFKTEPVERPVIGMSYGAEGLRFGLPLAVETEEVTPTRLLQSIGDKNARFAWIRDDIFPVWYDLTSKQPLQVREGMTRIINVGRQAGGAY